MAAHFEAERYAMAVLEFSIMNDCSSNERVLHAALAVTPGTS